ncbi:hypothetical protein SDC9_196438 [bioreactor metagenome]|uniref:Uncharacterized protein n=1 Tax=bioreactor metagenome TaxID=1076179 RepID=A0A645ID34_9ZZZZ
MQPHGPPRHAVTGDELHLGRVVARHACALNGQPQPLRTRIEIQRCRALAGMPSGQQIGRILQHERGIARTHERLGIGRGRLVELRDIPRAACTKGQRLALGIRAPARTRRSGAQ